MVTKPQAYSVDSSGLVGGFTHHDGMLLGLNLCESRLRLQLSDVEGSKRELVLDGVCMLSVDGFWEGNIVDSLFWWSAAEVPPRQLRIFCERRGIDLALAEEHLRKGLRLFSLVCSFGCDIFCLCKTLEVQSDNSGSDLS